MMPPPNDRQQIPGTGAWPLGYVPAGGSLAPTHSVVVGYVLWIFGVFGLHRFYYGRNVSGFVWLCTAGLLGVGWLVDLFLIPEMQRSTIGKYRAGKHNYEIGWLLLGYLGIFGAHRLYTGRIISGVLYFFTAGGLFIGWIYDLCTFNRQLDELNGRG